MKTLSQRMREHVESRGGCAKDKDGKPVIPNGAWSMMLEAADLLEKQGSILKEIKTFAELAGNSSELGTVAKLASKADA